MQKRPLWYIVKTNSSPMLPNTVRTRSQLSMAEPKFKPTTLWLDMWSGIQLQFWTHKSAHPRKDLTDQLQLSVRSVQTLR